MLKLSYVGKRMAMKRASDDKLLTLGRHYGTGRATVKRYREMMRDAKRYNGKLGGFVFWMKNRVKSGMSVQAAIKAMSAEIERRGGTLAGYNAKYKPQTLTEYVKLKRVYEADQEFLARLVRIGLLEACGHKAGDLLTIMLNRSFFDQTRIKTDGT